MIEHLVLYRPKPNGTPEGLERLLAALRRLKGRIHVVWEWAEEVAVIDHEDE